jgi:hypothetical protein
MKAATVTIALLAALLLAFTVLNWPSISAVTPVSLGFTTVPAPLGIVLLGASGLLVATFVVFVAYQQAAALLDARRFARDLHAQRELADRAEASRFTELRTWLGAELRAGQEHSSALHAATDARLTKLEGALLERLAEVGNGLTAHVAELEDKVERKLPGP